MTKEFLLKIFVKWFNNHKTNVLVFGNDCDKVFITNNVLVRKSSMRGFYEINTYIKEWEKEWVNENTPKGYVGLLSKGIFRKEEDIEELIHKIFIIKHNLLYC